MTTSPPPYFESINVDHGSAQCALGGYKLGCAPLPYGLLLLTQKPILIDCHTFTLISTSKTASNQGHLGRPSVQWCRTTIAAVAVVAAASNSTFACLLPIRTVTVYKSRRLPSQQHRAARQGRVWLDHLGVVNLQHLRLPRECCELFRFVQGPS